MLPILGFVGNMMTQIYYFILYLQIKNEKFIFSHCGYIVCLYTIAAIRLIPF